MQTCCCRRPSCEQAAGVPCAAQTASSTPPAPPPSGRGCSCRQTDTSPRQKTCKQKQAASD